MNHRAAGEVDGLDGRVRVPHAVHRAVDAPDPVGEREVNNNHPERHEEHDSGELHAFRDGAEDQRGRDDGEHELIHAEHAVADPIRVIRVRRRADAFKHRELLVVTHPRARAIREDEAVTEQEPQNGDEPRDAEALGDDGQDVFLPNETAVEEEEAGQRHEQDERGANHLESIVARAGVARSRSRQAFGNLAILVLERGGGIGIAEVGFQASHALLKGWFGRLRGIGRTKLSPANQQDSQQTKGK